MPKRRATDSLSPVPFYDLDGAHSGIKSELEQQFRLVLESNAYIGGPFVEEFEQEWAAYCEAKYAVGVANGTDAIELALRGLGIGQGDEVMVPANTFVATAEAVIAVGATVNFVDVDPGTLLLQADIVQANVTGRTAAVLVVHLYGQAADVDEIRTVTDPLGIPVIEDAAQAHGARLGGRRVGSLGAAACFSFYPGKNLGALGDGGAVTTDDHALAERIRCLANHGRGTGHYNHVEIGRNSRLDGLQAAFLSSKLKLLDDWNAARRVHVKSYREQLRGNAIELVRDGRNRESVYHLLVAQVNDRDQFRTDLQARGISTSIHYPLPCHRQPAFEQYGSGFLPTVERSGARIVSLPLFPHMTSSQVDQVCSSISEVLEHADSGGSR